METISHTCKYSFANSIIQDLSNYAVSGYKIDYIFPLIITALVISSKHSEQVLSELL